MSDDLPAYLNPSSFLTDATHPPRPLPSHFTFAPLFPVPSAEPVDPMPNVQLQPPLSRRGEGPGLVLVVPAPPKEDEEKDEERGMGREVLDPPPLRK